MKTYFYRCEWIDGTHDDSRTFDSLDDCRHWAEAVRDSTFWGQRATRILICSMEGSHYEYAETVHERRPVAA